MLPDSESAFRRKLAVGFLREAQQDLEPMRWRSCVDNSQLAAENAAKAALALLGPVGRTHKPAVLLHQAMDEARFPRAVVAYLQELGELAELLGPDLHVQSDYGDEAAGRTPWELFGEDDAHRCFHWAERAVELLDRVIADWSAQADDEEQAT